MRTAVVIPCYNHARYVGAAIESVLGQTAPPDRFLVIDDGSSDGSLEVLRGYEKDGVEVLAQPNAGAHATLNRAIARVAEDCGRVAILNSDDVFEPRRLEVMGAALEGGKAVGVSALNLVDDAGAPLSEDAPRGRWFRAAWSLYRADPEIDLCEWLGVANFAVTTSNILARADYLLTHPFCDYRYIHDYRFLLSAALDGELVVVDEPLLRYRAHDSNTIQTAPAPLLREMLRMNLDLYRSEAEAIRTDEARRARFVGYARAAWNNVSSLDAGLLQVLLAGAAAAMPEEAVAKMVGTFEVPELDRFPNSGLVREYEGEGPLVANLGLGYKIAELKRINAVVREENSRLKELQKLQLALAGSPWVALGRVLGQGQGLFANRGKTPGEKLEILRAEIEGSAWLRLGAKCGWKISP